MQGGMAMDYEQGNGNNRLMLPCGDSGKGGNGIAKTLAGMMEDTKAHVKNYEDLTLSYHLSKERKFSELLHLISTTQISNDAEMKALKDSALEKLCDIFDADACTIFQLEKDGGSMIGNSVNGGSEKIMYFPLSRLAGGIVRHCLDSDCPLIIERMWNHPEYNRPSLFNLGYIVIQSMNAVLSVEGSSIGVVQIMNTCKGQLTEEKKQQAKIINDAFKQKVDNFKQKHELTKDGWSELLGYIKQNPTQTMPMKFSPEKLDAMVEELFIIANRGRNETAKVYDGIFTEKDLEMFNKICEVLGTKINDYLTKKIKDEKNINNFYQILKEALNKIDPYTNTHSYRVQKIAGAFVRRYKNILRLTDEDIDTFEKACLLHDVGKLNIPWDILHKCGGLSKEEFKKMEGHPAQGCDILSGLLIDPKENHDIAMTEVVDSENQRILTIMDIIISHHEKYNGKGYPEGIGGEDINKLSRILSIVDAFDAMMSKRPYKDGFPFEKVINIIEEEKGKQFDPKFAELFIDSFKDDSLDIKDEKGEKISAKDLYEGDTYPPVLPQKILETTNVIFSILDITPEQLENDPDAKEKFLKKIIEMRNSQDN